MRYFFFDVLQQNIILNKMLDQFTTRAILIGKGSKIPLSLASARPFNIHHPLHDVASAKSYNVHPSLNAVTEILHRQL